MSMNGQRRLQNYSPGDGMKVYGIVVCMLQTDYSCGRWLCSDDSARNIDKIAHIIRDVCVLYIRLSASNMKHRLLPAFVDFAEMASLWNRKWLSVRRCRRTNENETYRLFYRQADDKWETP